MSAGSILTLKDLTSSKCPQSTHTIDIQCHPLPTFLSLSLSLSLSVFLSRSLPLFCASRNASRRAVEKLSLDPEEVEGFRTHLSWFVGFRWLGQNGADVSFGGVG